MADIEAYHKKLVNVYVPNYNTNNIMRNPVSCELSYTMRTPEHLMRSKNIYPYIPGHEEGRTAIDEEETVCLEKNMRIYNNYIFLPYNLVAPSGLDLMFRAFALSKSTTMNIIIPRVCLQQNAVCLYDVRTYNGVEVDTHGKACLLILSLFGGILGAFDSKRQGEGIGMCDPVDTQQEFDAKLNLYKKEKSSRKDLGIEASGTDPGLVTRDMQRESTKKLYEKMFHIQGFTITGCIDNPSVFCLKHESHPHPVLINRYTFDIEVVRDPNTREVMLYSIRITIIDPRLIIGFGKGIQRVIANNIKLAAEIETSRKKRSSDKSTAPSNVSFVMEDTVYNTRYLNGYEQICSTTDYINALKIVAGLPNYDPLASFPESSSVDVISNKYNPLELLNPMNMFAADPENPDETLFKFAVAAREQHKTWNQKQFQDYYVNIWKGNHFPMNFANTDSFELLHGNIERLFDPGYPFETEIPAQTPVNVIWSNITLLNGLLYIYPDPDSVFRLPIECIGSISILCFLLPDKNPTPYLPKDGLVEPSLKIPYPVQSDGFMLRNNETRIAVVRSIADSDSQYEEIIYHCDLIALEYFGLLPSPNFSVQLSPFYGNIHKAINSFRYNVIFPRAWETLSSNNHCLPALLRNVVMDMENTDKNGKSYMFVDFYNHKLSEFSRTGFIYHKNLTALGNFYVNFIELYAKKHWNVYQNFHAYLIFLVAVVAQLYMSFGYSLHFLLQGDTSSGKSRIQEILERLFYKSTYTNEFNNSARSIEYSKKSGMLIIVDDASAKSHPLLSQDNYEYEGGVLKIRSQKTDDIDEREDAYKTLTTKGFFCKSVTATGQSKDSKKTQWAAMFVLSIRRISCVINSNVPTAFIKEAGKSRMYIHWAKPSQKTEYVMKHVQVSRYNKKINGYIQSEIQYDPAAQTSRSDEPENVQKEFDAGKMLRSLQGFAAVTNYLIACGAIPYGTQQQGVYIVYYNRLQKILDILWPVKAKQTSRLKEDIIPSFMRAVTITRIWANICSGVYEDPDLRPDTPFNMRTWEKIAHINALNTTEEDFITTLSFFDHIVPPLPLVITIEWMMQEIKKSGCDLSADIIKVDPTKFRLVVVDQESYNANNRGGGNNGNMNSNNPPGVHPSFQLGPQDVLNMSLGNAYIENDVNSKYKASLMNAMFGMNHDNILTRDAYIRKDILTWVKANYHFIDPNEISMAMNYLYSTQFTVPDLEFKEVGNRNSPHAGGFYYTIGPKASGATINVTPLTLIRSNDGTSSSLLISVAWLYSITHKDGYYKHMNCSNSNDHKSTPMENVFTNFAYKGCKQYDIVLPGMFIDYKKSPSVGLDLQSYMKVLHYGREHHDNELDARGGSSSSSGGTYLFPDLEVTYSLTSNQDKPKYYSTHDNFETSYEECSYLESLILQFEQGYKNFDLNKTVSNPLYLTPNNQVFAEILKSTYEKNNPVALRKRFKAMMMHRQENIIYPEYYIHLERDKATSNNGLEKEYIIYPTIPEIHTTTRNEVEIDEQEEEEDGEEDVNILSDMIAYDTHTNINSTNVPTRRGITPVNTSSSVMSLSDTANPSSTLVIQHRNRLEGEIDEEDIDDEDYEEEMSNMFSIDNRNMLQVGGEREERRNKRRRDDDDDGDGENAEELF